MQRTIVKCYKSLSWGHEHLFYFFHPLTCHITRHSKGKLLAQMPRHRFFFKRHKMRENSLLIMHFTFVPFGYYIWICLSLFSLCLSLSLFLYLSLCLSQFSEFAWDNYNPKRNYLKPLMLLLSPLWHANVFISVEKSFSNRMLCVCYSQPLNQTHKMHAFVISY